MDINGYFSASNFTDTGGNNVLCFGDLETTSTLSLGKGNDTVEMSKSSLGTGTLYNSTFADAGGNNLVSIEDTTAGKLAISGSTLTFGDGHDTLMLESGYTLNLTTTGNQIFAGGAGVDVANLDGIKASLNLADYTTASEGLKGFEILDLSGDNANTLTLTSESLQNLVMDAKLSFTADGKALKNANAIRIQGDSEDSVIIDDRSDWCDLGQTSVGNISYDVFSTTDDGGKALYMLIQAGLL